jgi:hypothetical protein
MRSLKISLLLFALFVAASCSFTPKSSLAKDRYQISEIALERSGTWGLKSGYKLVLHSNGSGEYNGDVDAKRKGKYQGMISRDQFEQLARLIAANDFLLLKDKYHALVTDTDTVMVSIVYSGGRKTVEDFGRGGGDKLTQIEQSIDTIAEQIVWAKDEG